MGFSEMPTNNYVESSFWNFDALFQPQQHPARDSHDTFFMLDPATSSEFPMEYLEKVKSIHSKGGYGSRVIIKHSNPIEFQLTKVYNIIFDETGVWIRLEDSGS